MTDDLRSPLQMLVDHDDVELAAAVVRLPENELNLLLTAPDLRTHAGQVPPPGDWTTWLILAGRGFGKTFAGALWIDERARSVPRAKIALIAATLGEARSIMVESGAGIMGVAAAPPRSTRFCILRSTAGRSRSR